MACHQSHNIPWAILADNLYPLGPGFGRHSEPFNPFKNHYSANSKVSQCLLDCSWKNKYFPIPSPPPPHHKKVGSRTVEELSALKKQVEHFVKKLCGVIEEFAATELDKWHKAKINSEPEDQAGKAEVKVEQRREQRELSWPLMDAQFDEIAQKISSSFEFDPFFLRHRSSNDSIEIPPFSMEWWRGWRGRITGLRSDSYSLCSLSDFVKLLLNHDEVPALLTLALLLEDEDKGSAYLNSLARLGDHCSDFGVESAVEMALATYIHLNIMLATGSGTACLDPGQWHGQFARHHCKYGYDNDWRTNGEAELYVSLAVPAAGEVTGCEFGVGVGWTTTEQVHQICKKYFRIIYTYVALAKFANLNFDLKEKVVDVIHEFCYKSFRLDEDSTAGTSTN